VGQVRFHSADDAASPLQVICLAEVVNGRFEAEAPPSGPDVFVSVVAVPEGADVDAPLAWGALEGPLSLAGADHRVTVAIGGRAAWTERLGLPPERLVQVNQVQMR
jgi:hypothetical protein